MLEALKAALPDVYAIETRVGSLSEEELKNSIGRAPFVQVEYNSGARRMASEEGTARQRVLTFNLYVGAKSLRNKKDAQRGSYGILEAVREKLDGSTFTDTDDQTRRAGPFRWENEQIFADLPGGTVYIAVYSLIEIL